MTYLEIIIVQQGLLENSSFIHDTNIKQLFELLILFNDSTIANT
jgi:hypothetical protein